MTDEWASYAGIEKDFNGGLQVVKHNNGESELFTWQRTGL